MNTLPGLLAAACALWGAQTGYWPVAIAAAAALEAPRLVALRWNVEQAHFNRLSDFCSALIVAAGVYLYFTYGNPRALMLLFQWMPVLMLPLALAQAWGNLREVDVAAFVWTMRKFKSPERYALNLGYPCLAVWVVGAAAANVRGPVFFIGLSALAAWALWAARPRRYPVVLWALLVAATAGAGYGIQHGLQRAQAALEEIIPEWLGASGSRTDPYQSRTDLGHIGELKQDDAIVLRVRTAGGLDGPLLLRRATYNTYLGRTWSARNAPLTERLPESGRWTLARGRARDARVTVFDYSPRGNPVLSLPHGAVELERLEAISIKVNGLGTVQADAPPGFFSYVVAVEPGASRGDPPNEEDLRVPAAEQKLLDGIVNRLALGGLAPEAVTAAVKRHFADGFAYSLYQGAGLGTRSALADFLLRTKSGHCEYFATATVLLLRAAGVPARYSTGFSAQEYSRLEGAWVVRVRHAHAWAAAWVGGRWVDLDTTPSTWASAEEQQASSWWSPASDLWSWLRFRLAQANAGARDEERTAAIVIGVALLVGLWFAWRLYRQRRLMMFGSRGAGVAETPGVPGADSEYYRVERELARAGLGRAAAETVMAWLARIEDKLPAGWRTDELREIARLHYRYRFDPAGLPPPERERLSALARACLTR